MLALGAGGDKLAGKEHLLRSFDSLSWYHLQSSKIRLVWDYVCPFGAVVWVKKVRVARKCGGRSDASTSKQKHHSPLLYFSKLFFVAIRWHSF